MLDYASALVMPPGFDNPQFPLNAGYLLQCGLRDYQHLILLQVARLMRQGYRRILIVLPTGGGKTVLSAALLGSTALHGLTGEFVVHRKELINQTSVSFERSGLPHGFIAAKRPMDLTQSIILAGIQTLVNRLNIILPPDVVVLDEAHHCAADTWEKLLEYYAGSFVVGLTATPQRPDGTGLDKHFDIMLLGPTPAELIARGYLAQYDYYAPHIPDMAGVASKGGDYARGAATTVVDKPKIIGDIVEHYLRLGNGEQGIFFAVSRDHSRHIADAFNANGVPAMHIDGTTPDDERDRFDAAFRAGDIRMGVNISIFGEGYDVPNVGYVGMGAPTKSLVNHLQWCGRALRPGEGKIAKLADHAGNALPVSLGGRGHGLPDDDREWTLAGREKKAAGCNSDADPITQCRQCFRVYPSALSRCPGCAADAPAMPRVVQSVDGTLSKLEREEMAKRKTATRKAEESACDTYEEMVSLGRARGYEYPVSWAKRQCKFRRIAVPWGQG